MTATSRRQAETFHTEDAATITRRFHRDHFTLTARAQFKAYGTDSHATHISFCQLHSVIRWARRQLLAGRDTSFTIYEITNLDETRRTYCHAATVELAHSAARPVATVELEETSTEPAAVETAAEAAPTVEPIHQEAAAEPERKTAAEVMFEWIVAIIAFLVAPFVNVICFIANVETEEEEEEEEDTTPRGPDFTFFASNRQSACYSDPHAFYKIETAGDVIAEIALTAGSALAVIGCIFIVSVPAILIF